MIMWNEYPAEDCCNDDPHRHDPWQPKAQKWAISISNLEAKPKRSPNPQWQHIQNQGHVRMRSILN
jgi:hypothetical protein